MTAGTARREDQFPVGAALRLSELERFDNAQLLRRLRESEPVSWFAEQGVWLVTAKPLIDEVQNDSRNYIVDTEQNPNGAVLGRMMLAVDGAEHSRQRAPFAAPFKRGAVHDRLSSVVEAQIERLLAPIESSGEAELAMAFANPFAVSIASDVLGLELASFDEVHAIYTEFANGVVNYRDPNARKATIRAREQLTGLVMPIIEQRRCHPDDSLLSSVLRSEHLLSTDEELLANLRVILFGAIETVESMILNTAWALLHHREQLMAALADASLWPAVVQEGLRWIPPVGYSDRWTTQTVQLGGVTIPSGEYVVPVFAAANRDPGTFPDPDRFDISRGDDRRNLSFGKGIHMCLGVNLARLQGSLALKSLFERLPNLELNPERPSEPVGFNFRRPPHLYVRWRRL